MKSATKYSRLIISVTCLFLWIWLFGQRGLDLSKVRSDAEIRSYYAECRRIENHNAWVKQEEERLKRGQQTGACLFFAGLGIIGIGLLIRKCN